MGKFLTQLTADMKAAMKAGEKDRLQVVRMLIASIKSAQIDQQKDDLDDAAEAAILDKALKTRKEAIAKAVEHGRSDIAERERAEAVLIETYLPKKFTPAELAAKVQELAKEIGYQGLADGGRFMKEWMARHKGMADGRDVQAELKKL